MLQRCIVENAEKKANTTCQTRSAFSANNPPHPVVTTAFPYNDTRVVINLWYQRITFIALHGTPQNVKAGGVSVGCPVVGGLRIEEEA